MTHVRIMHTHTQLTGLSNACRRHTITISGTQGGTPIGEAALSPLQIDVTTDSLTTYDPATGIETETITSSTGPTIIRRSLHGVLLSTETTGETTYNSYDAFARVVSTSRTGYQPVQEGSPIGEAALSPLQSYTYSPTGDLLATHTYTNSSDILTETYAYDMLGNRTATTDAHGNAVFRAYDPFGRVVAEWGATYPVLYTYDTQGRRTSLTTFRAAGAVALVATDGDTTTWTYDPITGNCLSKTYADGSIVTHTYTPDNLLLRTTYPSGKWKETVYDAQRRLSGMVYSSNAMDYELQLDAYGNTTYASNAVAAAAYVRSDSGMTTNETQTVGGDTAALMRSFDGAERLIGLTMPNADYDADYGYDADGDIDAVSNSLAVVQYLYFPDKREAGYSINLANGTTIVRHLIHDDYRRSLVTNVTTTVNGTAVETLDYGYDAVSRPVLRNADTFGYNARNEVTSAVISGIPTAYGYDDIGNSTNCPANCLNQYVPPAGGTPFIASAAYCLDGNMTQCGGWTYVYDAGHQLKSVSSNGVLLVTNDYDARLRRVRKVTPHATTTFFYDDWNLIEERIAYTNGTTSAIRYYWGKDLSGTLQGAGGVGGLLYLTVDSAIYIPCYDNIGNITRYLDANGNTVAQYTYDAFGNTIFKSGPLADFFRHRFSTKYYDVETGLYYYGYRFYHPTLMRWLNRDPMEEDGGVNLYVFCANSGMRNLDLLGTTHVGQVLDSFFSMSDSEARLWVMGENDDYTAIVREWSPVKSQVSVIKSLVANAPRTWSTSHTTTPSWKPQMRSGFDPRSGYARLVPHPPGTDPVTAAKAYIVYIFTTIRTDALHTSSIGSFNIAATVDVVSFQPCRATINIWMYNEMSRRSFGRFADHWYFRKRSMRSQYMWWNWKERITFNGKGEYHDEQ